jgi:aminoglycoside 6'-N-acetyltransferase I
MIAQLMQIRPITKSDTATWTRLRRLLWPSEDHSAEVARFFAGELPTVAAVFVAIDDYRQMVGFAEASIPPYAEGCYSGRVAYLEGWFVEAQARQQGVGGALVAAVEEWGRSQGCTELGSDTEIANQLSAAVHRAVGFEEVERIICFRKPLG